MKGEVGFRIDPAYSPFIAARIDHSPAVGNMALAVYQIPNLDLLLVDRSLKDEIPGEFADYVFHGVQWRWA